MPTSAQPSGVCACASACAYATHIPFVRGVRPAVRCETNRTSGDSEAGDTTHYLLDQWNQLLLIPPVAGLPRQSQVACRRTLCRPAPPPGGRRLLAPVAPSATPDPVSSPVTTTAPSPALLG
ncbi:hypothetical protein HaLaN_03446 [Haematococcus lacustris]|uniref:Uncharacterized protein n=1 Tax=Haematococcus lacustris TaxID=44745 RepID=A0A699YNV6_HAELA|nr:hypothetical protein HaLaN_03446 [Haematococcus lacustris]